MTDPDSTGEEAANPQSPTAKLIAELVAKGLTQGEISRRTNIPQPRLSRYAQGKNTQVPDDVMRLVELNKRTRGPARRREPAPH